MIKKILSESVPIYGFCSYDNVKDSLIECRAIKRIPLNAQSVITALFPYYLGDGAYEGSDISKYAVVPDYHKIITTILQDVSQKLKKEYPDEEFVVFTDNSPIPEVKTAVLSGLGVRGLNGLFINKDYGSWVFIGEIVTTMKLSCNNLKSANDVCIGCRKCIDACPTGAINSNGIEHNKCLSHITQIKGTLTDEQENLIKTIGCAWGCDICQNVCPMNKNVLVNPIDIFKKGAELNARSDVDISDRAYAWRGEKVIRRNLEIIKAKD